MQVENNPALFSSDSAYGGITLLDQPAEFRLENFIAMDPPRHDDQRRVVAPSWRGGTGCRIEGCVRTPEVYSLRS